MPQQPILSENEKDQPLNPTSAVPKYFHFATVICQRFCSLPVGSVLPALTDLAKRFSVSKETINRSMRYLAQRGYVKSERGRGTYILRDLREALGSPVQTITAPAVGPTFSPTPTPSLPPAAGRSIGMILNTKTGRHPVPPDRNLAEIEIVAGLQHRLQQEGITLATVVVNSTGPYDLQSQLTAIPGLCGYVFMTQSLEREEAEQVAALKRPAVVINEDDFSDILTCVLACEAEGMSQLIEHLYTLGHRKIVYFSHNNADLQLDRHRGFKQSLQRHPDLEGIVYQAEVSKAEEMEALTGDVLTKHPGFTAYVGGAFELPHYFCIGLRALGLTPGKEISVAGFGLTSYEFNSVAEGHDRLTTVTKPRYEMGACAAETLINQSRQKYQQTGIIRIPTALQQGTTTGPAPTTPTAHS